MMATPRGTKRKSDDSPSADDQAENVNMTEHMMVTRAGSPSVYQEGPRKRQRTGITLGQKQALVDNLQLESTLSPMEEHPIRGRLTLTRRQSPTAPGNFERNTTSRPKAFERA